MMLVLELFRWAAVLIGITYGVTQASITGSLRVRLVRWFYARDAAALERYAHTPDDGDAPPEPPECFAPWVEVFVYCPTCVGFWVGAMLGLTGRLWPFVDDVAAVHAFDSAFASVLVTTLWSAATGGNHAHAQERGLIHGEPEEDDDAPQEEPPPAE